MSFSIFLPMRSGSNRVKFKNTRPFLNTGESLFQMKIQQILPLLERDDVTELVVSTNDEIAIQQLQPYLADKVKLDIRPDELCLPTTKVPDLINYVPGVISGKHIFWLHVTSPFFSSDDYALILEKYRSDVMSGPFDSLMSVNKIQQFIWDDESKKVVNVDRSINPWPNTQDLKPLYEINHAFYISSRENYLEMHDRIGKNPSLYICDGLKKIDIDWEDDFNTAQLLVNSLDKI